MNFDFDEQMATDKFFSSDTFAKLSEMETKLYEKNWTEIYELLQNELKL